jgi:aminopeptidase N
LSEGFAQYFAALYAQHLRGDEVFTGILRQLRRWSVDQSDNGPIYLGYRLGHIRGESRTFRALVYNKGAAVLHMLRRLVGDDAFFRGLRRFYRVERFQKAGTEGFRRAMEKEAGRPLDRFFERWIYGSSLPKLKFSYRIDGRDVLLHIDQIGDLFDVPVTVTLQYADHKTVDVLVPVTERSVEMRVALTGALRGAEISKDDGTPAEIVKG